VALFRRSQAPAPGPDRTPEHVEAFWRWWTEEGRAAAGTADGVTGLGEHLAPLGLTGEVLTDQAARPVLLVVAGGDLDRRATARRLVLAAPDDDGWTVTDHRPAAPVPEEVVLFSDSELVDLDRVRVAARMQGSQLDVTVHHPAYADLTAESRQALTVQALDAALGELGTELWIGDIEASQVAPVDGFGLIALRSVVQDLERQHVDADGTPRWVQLQGQGPSGRLEALVRRLLVPATSPHLDTYVSVSLPYRGRDSHGLPDEATATTLDAFAARLGEALGDRGVLVAHLSTGGTRTLHLFVDSTTDAVAEVTAAAQGWDGGRSKVHAMHDPAWDAVAHLRQ
jgi:hypothetical protein